MGNISNEEYRELQKRILRKNKLHRPRQTSPVYKDDKESIIKSQNDKAVQTLRDLQGICSGHLYTGDVAFRVIATHKVRGDIDNALGKGILDSLSKILYRDDRQVRQLLCWDRDILSIGGE